MKNHFKVATFNANSIRARLPLVIKWLEREKPDVLCLQETKVQDSEFPSEAFRNSGYQVVFRGEKARAGAAIASIEKPEEFSFGFPSGYPPDEDRLIRAVIGGIPIVNTYVPQGQEVESPVFQYKLEWLERLLDFFKKNYKPDEPLIWCGDFNVAPEEIDVYDPEGLLKNVDFHPEARARLERRKNVVLWASFESTIPGKAGNSPFGIIGCQMASSGILAGELTTSGQPHLLLKGLLNAGLTARQEKRKGPPTTPSWLPNLNYKFKFRRNSLSFSRTR